MNVNGPEPKCAVTAGLFDVAAAQTPNRRRWQSSQSTRNSGATPPMERARTPRPKASRSSTTAPIHRATMDFSPIVRAIAATNPDIVTVCSYPLNSVGILRTISEIGFEPKLLGGAMVGLQSSSLKVQLGPLLNGIVNYESWLPARTMQFPGVMEFLSKYQARAAAEGTDPFGYNMPPWGYADLQALEGAIRATNSIDDATLAAYLHANAVVTNRWDYHVRARRRMDQVQDAASSVPQHSRERFGAVQGYG